MAVMTRLTRLFRADVHAVLDRMEEPDVLLRQAIREMEDEVERGTRELRARELELATARRRGTELTASLATLAGELDLVFAANNEPLVRTLLRRRLEGERLLAHVDRRGVALGREIESRRGALEDQQRRLEAMRQKAALFEQEPRREGDDASCFDAPDLAVTDADIELALLRERARRSAS